MKTFKVKQKKKLLNLVENELYYFRKTYIYEKN